MQSLATENPSRTKLFFDLLVLQCLLMPFQAIISEYAETKDKSLNYTFPIINKHNCTYFLTLISSFLMNSFSFSTLISTLSIKKKI